MIRIELRSTLDQPVLDDILALIEAATRIEGHRPVGEHKYAHLSVGARNWVGVLAYDGDVLVGYGHTRWSAADRGPRMALEVVVHPEWHGSDVARLLLWEARSVFARAGGGLLYLWVHRVEDAEDTLARRLGFRVQRQLAFMTRTLDVPPQPPAPPEGIQLRTYRADIDDDAFLTVNNAAFAGHPENGGWSRADFAERRARDWFDPEGLLMAWRGERCLGFHWTKWHSHMADAVPAHEPVGEVYILGIRPDAQGMGLGRVLLDAGLAHLHRRGCRRAVLYVDCASSPAVRLYESSDFTLAYQEVCYQDVVAPVVDHPGEELGRPDF